MALTQSMDADVQRHLLGEMKQRVAQNKASLLVIGLTPVPAWAPGWLREQAIDYVECQHPDLWKDPALQVGGVGHPNAYIHRWWADCVLKALAERGFAAPTAKSRP